MAGAVGPTFHHHEFDPDALVAAKRGRRVSLCLPARDEQRTIGPIVERTRRMLVEDRALIDEVLVVDDSSRDDTGPVARAAGARVVRAADVLPELGLGHGKGEALWKATAVAEGDLLVFCDADLEDFDPVFVVGLLGPLLLHDDVLFVKAFYERALGGEPRGGGRVTELVARPLLALLFPHLDGIVQPLAGEFASRRDVLEAVPFVEGYGVDLGLLVDVAARFGPAGIAQVDLGGRAHRNRPLADLGPMATAVLQTGLGRAGVDAARPARLTAPGRDPVVVDAGDLPPLARVRAARRTA